MNKPVLLFIMFIGVFNGICAVGAEKNISLKDTRYCEGQTDIETLPRLETLGPDDQVDRIVVLKNSKKLYLVSQGQILRSYDVAFGFGFANGPKSFQGDGRTPEGVYKIEYKNPQSSYHLSLAVDYPNAADKAFAAANKKKTGGDIMVHGNPGKPVAGLDPEVVKNIHPNVNWTQGCMAVTDREIEEIFSYVQSGTTIEICPLHKNKIN